MAACPCTGPLSGPPLEELRAEGNTPDFILEHFIAFSFNSTSMTQTKRNWNLTVMAIQHYHYQSCSKLSKNPENTCSLLSVNKGLESNCATSSFYEL